MRQLRELNLEDVVFIDTETVRAQKVLTPNTPTFEAWEYKFKRLVDSGEVAGLEEHYIERGALYPEFAKLVCISIGRYRDGELVVVSYKDNDEKRLLERFVGDLDKVLKKRPKTALCGHSVKGFDIPFIFRRCLANGVIPNKLIDVGGVKPWELTALDTKELWKGCGYYSASLIGVCLALNIPSPKGDISGGDVGRVYYSEGEKGLERIADYCERDVLAVVNIVLRCRLEDIVTTYKSVKPKEPVKLGLLEVIAQKGRIGKEEEEELLSRAKGESIEGKEKLLRLLKASLMLSKGTLGQDLELKILSA